MLEGTGMGKTLDLLKRSMDVAVLRRDVIANNIANAEVPNYKRQSVNFEAMLKRALDSEEYVPPFELAMTDPKHMPSFRPFDYRNVEPRRVLDYLTTAKNNGNNVDPDREFMDSLNNQLSYTLMAQAVNHQFSQLNLVLR